MRNSHLSRRIDSLKSNHESVIDDLVKEIEEIEELEEEVDKLSDRIKELVDTIDDLKEKSNE